MNEPIRLAKRVIELTGCSRREAELYIEGGWVAVDGVVVEEPQFKVADQRVELLADATPVEVEPVTILLHADSSADPAGAPLQREQQWPGDTAGIRPLRRHLHRLKLCLALPAGASGLQVLTQDWRTERKLTEDAERLEQEYVVEVGGTLIDDGLELLNEHRFTFDGVTRSPIKASWQNENRLRFALKNPPSGLIEAMCEAVGLSVVTMRRIRVGGVPMAKLQPGQWRYLAPRERF